MSGISNLFKNRKTGKTSYSSDLFPMFPSDFDIL